MTDITKTIAEAREALAAYRRNSTRHYIDEALEDVLAALDAPTPPGYVDDLLTLTKELAIALSGCIELAEWWISRGAGRQMSESEYKTWLALGYQSCALIRAKAAVRRAAHAPAGGARFVVDAMDAVCLADTQRAIIEAAERRGYERGLKEAPPAADYAGDAGPATDDDFVDLPAAVPAANVTPLRQPRADLARLVESINAAVYDNAKGLSVTEAIGALELAKLELLKEQEQ